MEDPTASVQPMEDATLVALAQAGDASAMEAILVQYKGLVRRKASDHFLAGGDAEDVMQEGMIGLFKAVRTYRPEHGIPFSTFAAYCVAARITDAIRTASRRKHSPLNDSLSLQGMEERGEDIGPDLLALFIDGTRADPEQRVIVQESAESLRSFIGSTLTDLEQRCVLMLMEGHSYKEAAKRLKRTPKAVDNALRRARLKFEKRMRGRIVERE